MPNRDVRGKRIGNKNFVLKAFKEFLTTLDDFKGFNIDTGIALYKENYKMRLMIFLSPFIFTFIFMYFKILLSSNSINGLLVSFSIFTTLLFNFLLLMHNFSFENTASQKDNKSNNNKLDEYHYKVYIEAMRKTMIELRFAILVSIINLIFLLALDLFNRFALLNSVFSYLIYYLTILFLFVFMRTLKDVFIFSEFSYRKNL